MDPAQRERFILQQQMIRDAIWEDSKEGLANMLADDQLEDEVKFSAVQAVSLPKEERTQAVDSSLDTLAQQASLSDSSLEETEQASESRSLLIDSIREVNESKRQSMAAINALRLGQDQGAVGTVIDFVEIMTPFAEWIDVDIMLGQVTEGDQSNLLGQQKQELFRQIRQIPISERARFTEAMIRMVENNSTVILPDGNDIQSLHILEQMLVHSDYSDLERWFDNVTSILDVVGAGAVLRGAVKSGRTTRTVSRLNEATARNARIESTRTDVDPTSPSQIVKDHNPEQAREMHRIAAEDESGEAAEAFYGTTREEAIAKDLLPEPEKVKGEIPNKVSLSMPENVEPEAIKKVRLANGNTALSDGELARRQERLIHDFTDVEGMKLHPESAVIKTNNDGTWGVRARYSPRDSGFRTAGQALENASVAFRHYGLQPDDFVLYARQGDKWVETSASDLAAKAELRQEFVRRKKRIPDDLKDIDYSVGIKYDYRFRPEDLSEVDAMTTGGSIISKAVQFADRMPTQFLARSGHGSLVQNLLDAASVIQPQIVKPASVAVDRAFSLKKLYVDEFDSFTQVYKKLPRDRRALMSDYIHQANLEGLKLDVTDLYNRGFNAKEIEALKQWRRANDAMWYSANDDMVKTLRSQGFKSVVHTASDTKLVGRPAVRSSVKSNSSMFDVSKGVNTKMSPQDLDELYENGGEVVRLGEPIQIDGEWVDLVISRNTPSGGYTRAIYDGEVVLAYRDGYYPVMYDANFFVTKTVRSSDGVDHQKVVASARDRNELNLALKQLRESEPDSVFSSRKDRRLQNQRQKLFDEGSWSIASNSGLSAQKVRGERLADAGVNLHKSGNAHLKDPLEAVAAQIQQLSQKVSMRTYMETVKKRWLLNYEPHLDLPVNTTTGSKNMPSSVDGIKPKSEETPPSIVQEARTNFNYINSLENGYFNLIDETFRGVMHAASGFMSELGMNKLERAFLSAGNVSPTLQAKGAAFKLFISSAPGRQAVLQRGQMLMLGASNFTYFVKHLTQDLAMLRAVRAGGSRNPKYVSLLKEVEDSGILEAVDAHTLIRDDMLVLADLSVAQKARSTVGAPLRVAQKYGFDLAEQDVLLSAWLSFRDKALKEGRDITNQRVKDDILGDARGYTLTMNRAGEMPYSQSTLGLASQFFSFRHKAFLQPFTNRNLTVKERATLLAYTTALFGVDATLIKVVVDAIWDQSPPSELKDAINDGFLHTTLNATLTQLSGEDQNIDWGDLAPTEVYGIGDMFVGMLSTDLTEMIASSPSGSLLFGNNPKLTDAFKTGLRYFVPFTDYDDPTLETKFSDVVIASANMFSGFSSSFKANYAFHTRQKMSSSGRISDSDVTAVEAALATMGFQTETEVGYREVNNIIFGSENRRYDDDIKLWYRELKRHLARRHTNILEEQMSHRVLSEAWRVFGEDRPASIEVINNEIQKDAINGDYRMITSIIRRMGLFTDNDVWKMINALPDGTMRDRASELMQTREEMINGG